MGGRMESHIGFAACGFGSFIYLGLPHVELSKLYFSLAELLKAFWGK
jgi:hypothetical protein